MLTTVRKQTITLLHEVFLSSPFWDVNQKGSERAIGEVEHFSGDGRVQSWAAV